jgi:hypothetical protein
VRDPERVPRPRRSLRSAKPTLARVVRGVRVGGLF